MAGRAGNPGALGFAGLGALVVFLAAAALLAPPSAAADLRLRVVEAQDQATTAYVDPETGLYVIAPPTGHVEAEYGQRFLRARRAEYDPEAGTLVLEGEVAFREPGLEARAEQMNADLGQEVYRLEGEVRIERAGEEGGLATVLSAAQVTYRPARGEAAAGGDVRVEEGSHWFQAERARLWDGLNRLELEGQVAGHWGDGSVERADRVRVTLDSGEVTLFGPAEILFQVDEPPAAGVGPAGS